MKKSSLILALAFAAFTFSQAVRVQAQNFNFLASFNGTNGGSPRTVNQASDGNFYGPAYADGPNNNGTLFRMTPSGTITPIYNFCSLAHCADGALPGPSILGSDGNLYGVTYGGGYDPNTGSGLGTVYKSTLDGKITTLHTFCTEGGACPNGGNPLAVMQASDGNFYGTTGYGGAGGLLFRITASGKYTIVHSFCSLAHCADGLFPSASLIQGNDGKLYGTTISGGAYGGGAIYSVSLAGDFSVVRSFGAMRRDAAGPYSLVQDAKGNFFGAAQSGGGASGQLFEISSKGQYKVLHTFYVADNGGVSTIGITLANDGNLYGANPGQDGFGSIYRATPDGVYTTLYQFPCCDNSIPTSGLFQAPNGNLYGSSTYYGVNSFGAIYSLDNNLSPLVKTVPTAGKVGTRVFILGNGLKGSTSVKFNGKAASFHVVSDTEITAAVPAGATTGTVSVVTPSGTINSSPQFVVTK